MYTVDGDKGVSNANCGDMNPRGLMMLLGDLFLSLHGEFFPPSL